MCWHYLQQSCNLSMFGWSPSVFSRMSSRRVGLMPQRFVFILSHPQTSPIEITPQLPLQVIEFKTPLVVLKDPQMWSSCFSFHKLVFERRSTARPALVIWRHICVWRHTENRGCVNDANELIQMNELVRAHAQFLSDRPRVFIIELFSSKNKQRQRPGSNPRPWAI